MHFSQTKQMFEAMGTTTVNNNQNMRKEDAEKKRLIQEKERLQIQNFDRSQQKLAQKDSFKMSGITQTDPTLQLYEAQAIIIENNQELQKKDAEIEQLKQENEGLQIQNSNRNQQDQLNQKDQSPNRPKRQIDQYVSNVDNLSKRLDTLELAVNQKVLRLEQDLTASKNINVQLINRLSSIEVQLNEMMNALHLYSNPSELEKLRKQPILIDHRSHLVNNLAAQSKIEKNNETEQNTSVLILGDSGFLNTIYLLNSKDQSWKKLRITLPVKMEHFGAVVLNEEIYIFGGIVMPVWQEHCYKLKDDGSWINLTSLNQKRSAISSSSLVYKGDIWAIGGFDGNLALKSVERYDISQDKWTYMPEMNYARWNAAAAVFKDRIFVTGGESDKFLKSVEMFDPKLQKWILFCDLPIEVTCHTILINNSILSIFGGKSKSGSLNSVWEMDIDDSEQKWTEKQSFKQPRDSFGIGKLSNGIIVFCANGTNGETSEIFDGNDWIDGPKLPQNLSDFAYTTIPQSVEKRFLAKFS